MKNRNILSIEVTREDRINIENQAILINKESISAYCRRKLFAPTETSVINSAEIREQECNGGYNGYGLQGFEVSDGYVIFGTKAQQLPLNECFTGHFSVKLNKTTGALDATWGIKYYNDNTMTGLWPLNTVNIQNEYSFADIIRDNTGNPLGYIIASSYQDVNASLGGYSSGGALIKLDANGNLDPSFGTGGLATYLTNSSNNYPAAVFKDVAVEYNASGSPTGNYLVCGYQNGGSLTNPPVSNFASTIAKIGPTGLLISNGTYSEAALVASGQYVDVPDQYFCDSPPLTSTNLNDNNNDRGVYIKQLYPGGDFIMVNQFDYWLDFTRSSANCINTSNPIVSTPSSYFQTDPAIIRVTNNLNLVWAKNIPNSTGIDYFNPLKIISPGNTFLVGGNNATQNPLLVQSQLTKMDASGNILWTRQYFDSQKSQNEFCTFGLDIDANGDGGIIIGGNNDAYGYSSNYTTGDDEDYEMMKIYNDCSSPPNTIYDISNPSGTINLTANTHWNSNHKVLGEVVINAGVTLTIDNNAVIQFADSKLTGIPTGITVNQGGHLIVNTGVLTSITTCPNAMWDGVVAIGNPSTNQAPVNQGIVFMTGNAIHPSTISNARIGILLGYNGSGHFSTPHGGGSYAKCTNATFLNNNIDVQTVPYTNPTNPNANNTNFTNCTFTSNQLLNDPSYVDAFGLPRTTLEHVYLNGVKGINFYNCNFSTNIASIITDDRSIGLYSTDAMFTLTGPNPISSTNIFQNLRYGIYATATNPTNTYSVSYTNFTNCFASIYQSNINYSNVIFNQFQVTTTIPGLTNTKACIFNPSISNCRQYFYYLNQCHGYIHQENSYAVTVPGQSIYGTVFNSSTTGSNLSYRNTYSGVTTGTQAQAGNANLQISCNTFMPTSVSVTSDISVTSGAFPNQGSCPPPPSNSPAGNSFDHLGKDVSSAVSFVYSYFADASNVPDIASTGITRNGCTIFETPSSCLTNYPPPPVNPCAGLPPGSCRLAAVDSIDQVIKTMEIPLKQGEAIDLYNKINSVTIANIGTKNKVSNVEAALLAKSPYLSDSVLLTLLRHTPEFPQNVIVSIVVANSPVSTPVLAVVDSLALQSAEQIQINNAQVGVSARTELMEQLKGLYYQKENELNLAISEILLTNPGANVNTRVENLLSKDSSLNAAIQKVYFATAAGDNSVAQSLIDSLQNIASVKSIAKVQQYNLNVAQSGQTWADALQSNPAMKQDIMSIAADSTQMGYAAAGAILTSVYGTLGYEYIEGTQTGSGSRIAQHSGNSNRVNNNSSVIQTTTGLRAYPNPTNGMLNVEYNITDPTCNDATLQLVELGTGRILAKQTVACNSTNTQIDMNEFANGVYSLSIQSNLNAPKTLRIVKVQ